MKQTEFKEYLTILNVISAIAVLHCMPIIAFGHLAARQITGFLLM